MVTVRSRPRGKLILSDGSRFDGYLFGSSELPVRGEVVFNTSMTGYQEVITDPSYAGQLITMTYPHIGNYGVSARDSEAPACAARALIVRELSPFFSPGADRISLEAFMIDQRLPGITGVDTRALTLRIRSGGVVNGVIGSEAHSDAALLSIARSAAYSAGEGLVQSVTGRYKQPQANISRPFGYCAAVIDLGIKKSIVQCIETLGVATVMFDVNFAVEDILAGDFDFVVLSNGPGDPADIGFVIRKIEALIGNIPILGICLGHQIAALAMGGATYKMTFGHRGSNQPVICRRSGQVFITSQNHGYAVSDDFACSGVEITYINANDGTIEGFHDPQRAVECVQFHPEASPGPRDTAFLFEEFLCKVKGRHSASVA
ncbi:MAG: glutamine-hydrolyzing carbamoyl-phosphate synthase small subunit [Candidatus Latescibacterota bacterium]